MKNDILDIIGLILGIITLVFIIYSQLYLFK
jgi:hypothetical protein